MSIKKGQIMEGTVRAVQFPNKGVVYVEGEEKPVIVKNAITGQKVRACINKMRKGKAEGRLLEVLQRAPQEVETDCPHFAACGGCTYRTLPYEDQLKLKANQVKSLLDEVCEDYEFEGIKGSPLQNEYRNKMEFSFGDAFKDGPLSLGMHKRGSFYDIVTVDGCRIVDEDFRRILRCVLDFFQDKAVKYYHKMRHEGYLRHLLVRKGRKTGEILVSLVTTSQRQWLTSAAAALEDVSFQRLPEKCEEKMLEEMTDKLCALSLDGTLSGVLHTVNDSLADVIQNDHTEILYGEDYFYEELLGLRFQITPFSFFQTNSAGAEVLYDTVRSYVGETKDRTVFDLYSGTGTIAQILAPVAKKVVGVEIVAEAVEAAKANAKLNGLDNCTFYAGDVLKVLDDLSDKPDIIVLDPPRDGLHPKALIKIVEYYNCEHIVYISCKPTSLARDLAVFQEHGYRVEKACCIDLFPGAFHVETCCLLTKASNSEA